MRPVKFVEVRLQSRRFIPGGTSFTRGESPQIIILIPCSRATFIGTTEKLLIFIMGSFEEIKSFFVVFFNFLVTGLKRGFVGVSQGR